jgi:hypothetical protein
VVVHTLDRAFGLSKRRTTKTIPSQALYPAVACVLGMLARRGTSDASRAAAAFQAGWKTWSPGRPLELPPPEICSLAEFAEALDLLSLAHMRTKERLLQAMLECIHFDHKITANEYALLRTVCAVLDLPLPLTP